MGYTLFFCLLSTFIVAQSSGNIVQVPFQSDKSAHAMLTLAVGSDSSFRLSVRFGDATQDRNALPCPSLDDKRTLPPSTTITKDGMKGIQTSFGSILSDAEGNWEMLDSNGALVVSSDGPPRLSADDYGTVQLPVIASDAYVEGQPCLGNGQFAPPFYWDQDASFFSFAVSPWLYDPNDPAPKYIHCYPAGFKTVSASADADALVDSDTCSSSARSNNTDVAGETRSKKYPDGVANTTIDSCCSLCNGDGSDCIAWVWADPQHPDSTGTNCWLFSTVGSTHARPGRVFGGSIPPSPSGRIDWWVVGWEADWYLAPAKTGYDFTAALFQLTGAPAVPPRYGMAFMATYWGYSTMQQVWNNMTAFRDGQYPVDSFIMDYDWFGPQPCGPTGAQGGLNCGDFGYKPDFFGNNTFQLNGTQVTTSGAKDLLDHFHNDLHMRWGGIRKPRSYSNIELSNTSGWLLPDKDSVGAGGNNWNYTIAEFRTWYTSNHLHFLKDGVDFWWNDEGETQWFTYLYWNIAQQEEWNQALPGRRHFTINRAFQPGMQRYAAVTWSGDGQDCSHAMAIRFTMYGQPYIACDMTSPDATVLVRQYQNGVFLPIFRVHQMHGTPRFPFMWCGNSASKPAGGGTEEHCTAFREALNTRYRFLPYLYSLAHAANRQLRPISRPASFEFPNDPKASTTYMVGDALLPADVSTSHRPDPNANTTTVYLPEGTWYLLNTTKTVQGSQTIIQKNTPLTEFPVYVRQGAILTLQATTIQYSDLLGGLLQVQVYAGRSSSFDMVEDDGETTAYLQGATRTTTWTWDDTKQTLSWNTKTSYVGSPQDFKTIQPVFFSPGKNPVYASVRDFTSTGSITF